MAKVKGLFVACLFALASQDGDASAKTIILTPECVRFTQQECSLYLVDTNLGRNRIAGMEGLSRAYVYVFNSKKEKQSPIYWNNALTFIYDIIGHSMETSSCKIIKLDTAKYSEGVFMRPTPKGFEEYVISANFTEGEVVDIRRCEQGEIEIAD